MAVVLEQLTALLGYASEIYQGIYDDLSDTSKRLQDLSTRVGAVSDFMPSLEDYVDAAAGDAFISKGASPFSSETREDAQLLRKETRTTAILDVYDTRCVPPPDLSALDEYRDDGGKCLKEYTNPDYFIQAWLEEQKKKAKEARQRRQAREKTKGSAGNLRKANQVQEVTKLKKTRWNQWGEKIEDDEDDSAAAPSRRGNTATPRVATSQAPTELTSARQPTSARGSVRNPPTPQSPTTTTAPAPTPSPRASEPKAEPPPKEDKKSLSESKRVSRREEPKKDKKEAKKEKKDTKKEKKDSKKDTKKESKKETKETKPDLKKKPSSISRSDAKAPATSAPSAPAAPPAAPEAPAEAPVQSRPTFSIPSAPPAAPAAPPPAPSAPAPPPPAPSAPNAPPPPSSSLNIPDAPQVGADEKRSDLLLQIQAGKQLKKAQERKLEPKETRDDGTINVAAILQRRMAFEFSDDEDDGGDSDGHPDSDWDD